MQHCPACREQTLVLVGADGGQGGVQRGAAFDLDDGEDATAPGEDVDLSGAVLQAKADDLIALGHQPGGGDPFGGVALAMGLAAF